MAGLIPDMAGTQLMRHLAREDIVRELTYTGRIFWPGEEAFQYGFATRVCADPRAEALATARERSPARALTPSARPSATSSTTQCWSTRRPVSTQESWSSRAI